MASANPYQGLHANGLVGFQLLIGSQDMHLDHGKWLPIGVVVVQSFI